MGFRFYARRTLTGEWLHTNVPMAAEFTRQLGASGNAAGFIPAGLDVEDGPDGLPLWLERGTTLIIEEEKRIKWAGLCSWQRPTRSGREVEFKGVTSALDLIEYAGRIRQWQPDPFDIVEQLVDHAQNLRDGDVGLHVVRDGQAPTYAGDEQPPSDRPENVKRRRGETLDHFEARREDREKEQKQWDKEYGDRRPYSLAWWEAPYIKEELLELAREIPFDWHERHRWTDRDALEVRHELVLSPRKGRQRTDLTLMEGVNIAATLDPSTDSERYGNRIVMLGAGEGRKMRRAMVGASDGRVRTTRFGEAKHVHNEGRLKARARDRFRRMPFSVKLDEAAVRADLGALELGDEVRVMSRLFTGWCRVYGITRSTRDDTLTLTFTDTGGGAA